MSPDRPAPASRPDQDDFEAQVTGIAALREPIRRSLYQFVVAQPEPVSRDQAAAALAVAHHVAKFHLDRLVQDGLLEVEYRRPSGRGGPGAGRPTKLYRRAPRQLSVSLPERHYELAGRLLASAVTEAQQQGIGVPAALTTVARGIGRTLGREARDQIPSEPSRPARLRAAIGVLTSCGYEPRATDDRVTLVNCPFHALAQDYTELVCGMNLDLITGLVEGLGSDDLAPRLDPTPGQCCVVLDRRPRRA